tara:strand:- start:4 stop:330 length:327 start_codon:yes stop_codon:yes gene_type:complete
METWKRLTPHSLRWIAIAIGIALLVSVLASDFLELLPVGLGYAFDNAQVELFGRRVACPYQPGRLPCAAGYSTAYLIDLPLKGLAIVAIILAGAMLYVASKRQRDISS